MVTDKELLNKFAKSQPALQRPGLPAEQASLQLGDMVALGGGYVVAAGLYDFAVLGGAVSDIVLPLTVPAGAIVVRAHAEVLAAVTSAGSGASIAVKSGSDVIVTAVDAEATFTLGAIVALNVNPKKAAAASSVAITVSGEALTAGKINFYIQYILVK